jgi:protein-disulfide isomerase
VLEKYPNKIKLVFKNFPLSSIHPFAHQAALAALAAHAQGKFWEFHNTLFEHYKTLNDVQIQEIAKGLKLDMEKFNREMKGPSLQKLIARDIEEGRQAGVEGIPALFVNGKLPPGGSLQGLEDLIEAELKKGKKK